MPDTESTFDAAAEMARPEPEKLLEDMTEEQLQGAREQGAKKILTWQKKWYLQAGHKRLGRIIVEFAKSYKC